MGKENLHITKEGGLTHIHTEMSLDAVMSLEEIGDYVMRNLSSDYIIICDHLTGPYKEQKYSVGELQEVIEKMLIKVSQYNETHKKPKCVSGIEANIVTNGVDIPDELLSRIDFVIASRHFPWGNEDPAQITNNLISAMENEHIDAIGHINRYVDKHIDWNKIFKTAEKTRTVIEINFDAPPSMELLRIMSRYNLIYSIGIDFHTFQGLKNRVPVHSQIVTNILEAKKMALEWSDKSIKLRNEYLQEPVGYKTLKKLVIIIRSLEEVGISITNIINVNNYEQFLKFLTTPKYQRSL